MTSLPTISFDLIARSEPDSGEFHPALVSRLTERLDRAVLDALAAVHPPRQPGMRRRTDCPAAKSGCDCWRWDVEEA